MDEGRSREPRATYEGQENDVLPPRPLEPDGKHGDVPPKIENWNGEQPERALKERWHEFWAADTDRHVELILAGAITLFALCQLVITCSNNASTGRQMSTLLSVASSISNSANSFSGSANNINNGIDDAVGKLNDQAGDLKQSADQSRRLANATEKANENILAADRPWVGLGLSVNDFQAGKSPVFTISVSNSGRRPAKITSTGYGCHVYESLPESPEFDRASPDMYSSGIVVPGASGTGSEYVWIEHTMDQKTLDALNGGQKKLFCYANIEYSDVRTGEPHFTHGCVRYVPPTSSYVPSFQSCHEYNDAQ